MRIIPLCVLFAALCSPTLAQVERLPDILKPDAASEFEAKRMGAQVFKLVPRGMFNDISGSYKDEDNPIGIRGGGAYYSFATGLHSYNRVPELGLQQGSFSSGFAGCDYGFLVDLGPKDLVDVETLPEAEFFISYKPPFYEKDIRQEAGSIHMRRVDELAMTLQGYVPAKIGHTYLLRAINWDEANTVVAFQVLKIDKDGSATIAWKKLADLPKPYFLYMPDEELQNKVSAMIADEKIPDIEVTVKDNWLYLNGSVSSLNRLNRALHDSGTRYRGAIQLSSKPAVRP